MNLSRVLSRQTAVAALVVVAALYPPLLAPAAFAAPPPASGFAAQAPASVSAAPPAASVPADPSAASVPADPSAASVPAAPSPAFVSAAQAPASALAVQVPASARAAARAAEAPAGLPRPTGPHAVGRATLHLTDSARRDPWVPAAGARQLMVSVFYPARPGTGGPTASYMTPEEARLLLRAKAPDSTVPAEALSGIGTWSRPGARPAHGRYPLVVLSPGFTLPRATLTGLAEDLASRGYVVAVVDHLYETTGTTLPGGRTVPCAICDEPPAGGYPAVAKSRAADLSFVLDRLTGSRPAWRYARMIDPARIGMAGHSIGGAATAATMAADPRVRAGANMDGTFFAPVSEGGLGGRPFLLLGQVSGLQDQTWNEAWAHLDGWKRWVTVAGADHGTFTDAPVVTELLGVAEPDVLSGARSEAITRAYLAAFFDRHLKGNPRPLLDGPSARYPEVSVRLP
ncbi:alpha/beta hydrolase [Streptomyces actinomycinicus]|uniref:Alpha/beta hydrolase n=1 Tax=Streptomyces actinomycinicus TaxID=1695166 RepID=A0A937EHF7_9ACTN|nr:alpha/beta hydrolase [Streptomyces actinomycinicus]MBL1082109.1 alpha/beta hydrolase [Streptomyces actinomycinicus]